MEYSYAYPAHDVVRRAWMSYLPRDLSNSKDLIMYLPGPENLELPGYLAKGMRPGSQLIGVEHKKARFEQLKETAGGIILVSGSVPKAVELHQQKSFPRLRAVNLDFDGNLHTYIEELFALGRIFPSTRGGYLGVTSYAARDRGAVIQGIVNACKFYSGLSSTSMFITQFGRMIGRYEHMLRLIPHAYSTPVAHFHRELELLWWIVLMLSAQDAVSGEKTSTFNSSYVEQIDDVLSELTTQVTNNVALQGSTDSLMFIGNRELRKVLTRRRVTWLVQDIQRYVYWSSNRQPIRTWFFHVVRTQTGQRETAQSLLEQVWHLASSAPLVYVDPAGDRVTIG